jgi:hypothetical protein
VKKNCRGIDERSARMTNQQLRSAPIINETGVAGAPAGYSQRNVGLPNETSTSGRFVTSGTLSRAALPANQRCE